MASDPAAELDRLRAAPTTTTAAPADDHGAELDELRAAAPAAPAGPIALATMIDPSQVPAGETAKPVLGIPAVQSVGAGAIQGGRDVAQTIGGAISPIIERVNTAVPALGALDKALNFNIPAGTNQLADQTKAFNTQYGEDLPANIGRVGGQIAATLPLTGGIGGVAARGATALGELVAPIVGRILGSVAQGAVAGGGTNALVSGGTGENPLAAAATGALGGGILGGGLTAAGRLVSRLSGGAGSEVQTIANRLGIDLSSGQKLGGITKHIEDASGIVPGSGAAKFATQQNSQIASVLEKEMGIAKPTGKLDTTSLNAARQAAGDRIETAASKIDVPGNQSFLDNMAQTESNARISGVDAPQAKAFDTLSNRVMNIMASHDGTMPGSELQKFIAKGGELDAALNSSNPEVASVAAAIREHLLDAGANSSNASAQAVKDLQKARYQYKVAKTIEPAITKAADGSDSMSLQGLKNNIWQKFGTTGTGPENNMQDLARLINGIKPLPSSGTAERSLMYKAVGLGGLAGGGGIAYGIDPDRTENFLTNVAPYAAGLVAAGRGMRFGPGMGLPLVGGALEKANPLLPRLYGPRVGKDVNQLMSP